MGLCGFSSPDGRYTECLPYKQLDVATRLCEEQYNYVAMNRINAEDYLYNKGYVVFYSRNASKRFCVSTENDTITVSLLTDEQIKFIEKYIYKDTLIDTLEDDLKEMLSINEERREHKVPDDVSKNT